MLKILTFFELLLTINCDQSIRNNKQICLLHITAHLKKIYIYYKKSTIQKPAHISLPRNLRNNMSKCFMISNISSFFLSPNTGTIKTGPCLQCNYYITVMMKQGGIVLHTVVYKLCACFPVTVFYRNTALGDCNQTIVLSYF